MWRKPIDSKIVDEMFVLGKKWMTQKEIAKKLWFSMAAVSRHMRIR